MSCESCPVYDPKKPCTFFCTDKPDDNGQHPAQVDPTGAAASCEMTALYEKPAKRRVQKNSEGDL